MSVLVAAVFLMSLVPASSILAEGPAPGEIIINKTSTPVDGNPRQFDIELTVRGTPLEAPVPTDIVLVLDISNSMNYKLGGISRLKALKNAANDFIDGVLTEYTDAEIAIVTYSGAKDKERIWIPKKGWKTINVDEPYNDATIAIDFSKIKADLHEIVNELEADGGTNMQSGFIVANSVLKGEGSLKGSRLNARKMVIFMTDGVPTYYYDSNGLTAGPGNVFSETARDEAIAAAKLIDADVYTVGLIPDGSMNETEKQQVESVLDPTGENKYQTKYFSPSTADELSSVFQELIIDHTIIATNASIVDIIDQDFSYVSDSASDDPEIIGNKLVWQIEDIGSQEQKVSLRIEADDYIFGQAYTNEAAYLYFDPIEENTFYANGYDNPDYINDEPIYDYRSIALFENGNNIPSKMLEYNMPVEPLQPTAVDDEYQVIIGGLLEVEQPGVMTNDMLADIYKMEDDDWIINSIETEKLTDPVKGNLESFGSDGSFVYLHDGEDLLTDSFEYLLKVYMSRGEEDITLSDTAVVNIEILPLPPEPTPVPTETPTLPTITDTTDPVPLAPVLPTISVIEQTLPLASVLPTIAQAQEQIPKSGENAPLWPLGLALIIIAVGAGLLIRRHTRKEDKNDLKEWKE